MGELVDTTVPGQLRVEVAVGWPGGNGGDPAAEHVPAEQVEHVEAPATAELSFDERLALAAAARATQFEQHGKAMTAAEADVNACVTGLVELDSRHRLAAERDRTGQGTPTAALVLDTATSTDLGKFRERMSDGPGASTWSFSRSVEVPPPARPAPTAPTPPALGSLSRRDQARAIERYEAARQRYEAERSEPVVPAPPEIRNEPVQEVTGWPVGYATKAALAVTPEGREVWTSLQEPPDLVVLSPGGTFFGIPQQVADSELTPSLVDTLPRGLPLNSQGVPMLPELGEFGPVHTTTVQHNGSSVEVQYSQFSPSNETLRDRLFALAVDNLPVSAEATAAVVPHPATETA